MTVNINIDTGIRYGVTSHNQTLIQFILDSGVDESFEAHKRDCIGQVSVLLAELGQRNADEQAKDIVDNFEWDDYQCDEPDYSYTDDRGNVFHLSWLGGAPLVYCIKTSVIVRCKSLCSPCVPNAGDLDSGLADDDSGYECYGVPDEYADDET